MGPRQRRRVTENVWELRCPSTGSRSWCSSLFFGGITILGFAAANWRKGDLDLLHEWGLGGGRFGTLVTWFLIGGDIYTAYTFIAVPALAFGAGAIAFFAVPYTTIIYPMTFVVFPRLWSVCRQHGYITSADFVRGRFGNRWLALAVALTGLLATMPYIALQLVGLQVVIGAMGVETSGIAGDLPLILAFVILAVFTYKSGLRAPAAIAVVKDVMIYATIIAVLIVVSRPSSAGSAVSSPPSGRQADPGDLRPRTRPARTRSTPRWRSARPRPCSSTPMPSRPC